MTRTQSSSPKILPSIGGGWPTGGIQDTDKKTMVLKGCSKFFNKGIKKLFRERRGAQNSALGVRQRDQGNLPSDVT